MINDCTLKASINVTTVMEKEILPLAVEVELGFVFDECDPYHQAVALERVRFFLNTLLDKSMLVSRKNELAPTLTNLIDTPVIECWDEPWDQFIAIMIYYKTTAILEGAGFIEFIRISGDSQSPDMEFEYNTEIFTADMIDSDVEYLKKNKKESLWYHRKDASVNDDENVLTWEQLGLSWQKQKEKPDNKDNVKKFTPKIIK